MSRELVLKIEVFETESGNLHIWREWPDGSFEAGLPDKDTEREIRAMIERKNA